MSQWDKKGQTWPHQRGKATNQPPWAVPMATVHPRLPDVPACPELPEGTIFCLSLKLEIQIFM